MASYAMKSSFCLFVAAFCLALNVEAREGKLFFSRFTHKVRPGRGPSPMPVVSPTEGPSPAPAPAPATAPSQTHIGGRLGDGHFGAGSGMIPQTKESWPTTTTNTTSDEFDKLLDKFDGEKSHDETDRLEEENYNTDRLTENIEKENYEGEGYEKRSKYYNPREQNSNYYYYNNNNGYRFRGSNYRSNNYNENMMGGHEEEEEEERPGMSDTRFMENGRYFYDVKGENYENDPNRYGGVGAAGEGYEKKERARKYPNEFDTMEEYYQSLEGPQQSLP